MLTFIYVFSLILFASLSSQEYTPPFATLPPTPQLPQARETGYVNLTKVDIWYAQFGPTLQASKACDVAPILFLHGGLGNSDYFGDQITFLLQQNTEATIIAIDSRMQGRSTGINQPISYDLMREDVVGVLDHFNISSATVVGWSDGGIIGLDLAMNAPSRLNRLFAFAASYSYTNLNATLDDAATSNAYLARTRREYKQLSPTPNQYDKLYKKLDHVFSVLPNYTQTDFAKIPTLYQNCEASPLIWIVDGADEEVINRGAPATMHDWLPGSGLVILPSVSHFAFLQDPETFNTMLWRFLNYKVNCE